MTGDGRPLRYEDLEAWCALPGRSLELLAGALVPAPSHGTDQEFEQWQWHLDRLVSQLRAPPAGFPSDELRARIERVLNEPGR
ncbi:MAG: hypothetical protein KC593_20945 [Myxococcales bacterium]|nr:hypothetical protein [Myxococcales bacterium]